MKTNKNNDRSSLSQFLNERISFFSFLLIDENGSNVGLVDKKEGLERARELNLDLFCITPQNKPPVCRILDFSKYAYQLRKKNSEKKINNKKFSLKEAKFSFRISENDSNIKIKKILNWLENCLTVRVVLFMKGREQQHKDIALEKCNKIISEVQKSSPYFQLKDEIRLIGSMYVFTFFKNRKITKDEKNKI